MTGKLETERLTLLRQYADHGPLTDEEAAEHANYMHVYERIRRRITDLRNAGLIAPTGETGLPLYGGRRRPKYAITRRGRRTLRGDT